jgi:hypothetical protein
VILREAKTSNHQSEIINGLALALLVARVLADDAHDVLSLHDAAAFAKAFDGGSDFHGWILRLGFGGQKIALKTRTSSVRSTISLLLPEGDPAFGQVVGRHF